MIRSRTRRCARRRAVLSASTSPTRAAHALVATGVGGADRGAGAYELGSGLAPPRPLGGSRPDHAIGVAGRAGHSRGRYARHQGRGAALHSRYPQGQRYPHAVGRSLDRRPAVGGRRGSDGNRAASSVRRQRRVHRRPRRLGRRHGAGLRGVDRSPERDRRHHRRRRLGRHLHGGAGNALASRLACRRS